ncbi:MAG: M14 family zinc carboxypeptidase [Chitinophagales bacterium]
MKQLITIFLAVFFCCNLYAQETVNLDELFADRVEVYFEFEVAEKADLAAVSKLVSIDHGEWGKMAKAYANEREFKAFLATGLPFKILPPPSTLHKPKMMNVNEWKTKGGVACLETWDFYPTYSAYETIMADFAAAYPDLCRIVEFGQLPSGRKLLAAVISDNVAEREVEPRFLYTSSIHGDETTGFPLMLQLIDYLLCEYGSNDMITNIVDGMEIWINPLANPDGTYTDNNETVFGATRYNSEGHDLNRNYPDPIIGNVPVNQRPMQLETSLFMALAEENHFVMSANFHGGTEVVNYPWDTRPELHADDDWWFCVSSEYAESVHTNGPSNYFDGFGDGVTNGYEWYEVDGGRQDYMTYYQHGREVTIELSDQKLLSANKIAAHWDYNRDALLNYMEHAMHGFQGVVTDALTGEPIEARLFVRNHDFFNSDVYSNELGCYARPIIEGTYTLLFSADGYLDAEYKDLKITKKRQGFRLDVSLMPEITSIEDRLKTDDFVLYPNPAKNTLFLKFEKTAIQLQLFDMTGRIIYKTNLSKKETTLDISDLEAGIYWVKAIGVDWSGSQKMVVGK